MGNICSLNIAVTVYRACSSSVVFSHCSGEWWTLQKHHLEQQSWGFGSGCLACPSVSILSLLGKDRRIWVSFGSRHFYLEGPLGLRTESLWSCGSSALCGAALGALAAAAHERELGESAKVFPQPNKTAPRSGICLPTYELCSLQTFTFPDSEPSCQKFSFIFQYFFLNLETRSLFWNTSPIFIIALFRRRQMKRFLNF